MEEVSPAESLTISKTLLKAVSVVVYLPSLCLLDSRSLRINSTKGVGCCNTATQYLQFQSHEILRMALASEFQIPETRVVKQTGTAYIAKQPTNQMKEG